MQWPDDPPAAAEAIRILSDAVEWTTEFTPDQITSDGFGLAALEHRRSELPPPPKSPRLRRLRETVALWLAPWIAEWDEEGW